MAGPFQLTRSACDSLSLSRFQTGCGAMIFTLFGYLLLVGIVKRDLRSSIVSLAVFVMV